jgi:IS605 OrfB family transposase
MPISSPPAGSLKAVQTAVFAIRAPSAYKRAALFDAMKRTHLATEAVLQAQLARVEEVKALSRKIERTNLLQTMAYAALRGRALSVASAAAARVDASGMVESYIQTLVDGRAAASVPTVLPLGDRRPRYREALQELVVRHTTVDLEGELRDEMNRMSRCGFPRPLSFHGYGHFYHLLKHPRTGRLYAWLNILSKESRFAPSIKAAKEQSAAASGDMVDIGTGELIRCRRPTWMLFPLEFSFDYHERDYIMSGQPRGGRLVYRPDRDCFELHAAFEFEAPARKVDGCFMGIDRGIYNLASWAVVNADGRVLEDGEISGMELRHAQRAIEARTRARQKRGKVVTRSARRAQADEAVHKTANAIVEAAQRHGARVVIEQLTIQRRLAALPVGNKGGSRGRPARRILGRQQCAKLVQVLAYKLPRAGLPPPIEVGAAFTSQTCPECSHVARENRLKVREDDADKIEMSRFKCVRCGHESDADRNTARVIAIKGAWLSQVPTKKQRDNQPLRDDQKFAQYLLDAIARRGSSAGSPVVPS